VAVKGRSSCRHSTDGHVRPFRTFATGPVRGIDGLSVKQLAVDHLILRKRVVAKQQGGLPKLCNNGGVRVVTGHLGEIDQGVPKVGLYKQTLLLEQRLHTQTIRSDTPFGDDHERSEKLCTCTGSKLPVAFDIPLSTYRIRRTEPSPSFWNNTKSAISETRLLLRLR
jgi:hypothetical protein